MRSGHFDLMESGLKATPASSTTSKPNALIPISLSLTNLNTEASHTTLCRRLQASNKVLILEETQVLDPIRLQG